MPTTIYFPGGDSKMKLHVNEEPSEVQGQLTAAQGEPFRLTSGDQEVWVNPANIAYWVFRSGESPRITSLG